MPNTNLPETKCQIAFRRGGDDLPEITEDDAVFILKGVYGSLGEKTKAAKLSKSADGYCDTRMVASTPGMWLWMKAGDERGNHPSGRKVGIQCNFMLSSPPKAKSAEEKKKSSNASEMI